MTASRSRRFTPTSIRLIALAALLLAAGSVRAQEPLRVRIDRLVDAAQFGPAAPAAADDEFLRRASLALTGTIPSASQTRAFLDSQSPDKRAALVDQLLASPAHARHMAATFDVMLMERRADPSVPRAAWRAYLQASFTQNKPYDQLAREILTADGVDPAMRPAARFVLDRAVEPNLLTRDVSRLFFGRDLQCAQCHDHPLISSYRQAEYFGLYAFFSRSAVFTDDKKVNTVVDGAAGEVSFVSVFKKSVTHTTRPQVVGGGQIADPPIKPGEEYTVKPAKNVRHVPAYSRRLQLSAEAVGGGGKAAFDRNIANRLWAHMMGRGLVEPLDLHHADNPPSNPQLLELLAGEFAAMKYDVRGFLRELALTATFARSFELPASVAQQVAAAQKELPALEAQQQKLAASVKTAEEAAAAADEALNVAAKERAAVAAEHAKAAATVAGAQKAADPLIAAVIAAQQPVAARQDAVNAVAEALARTQDAAKKLPMDKDLADVAAKLQGKAAQLNTELAALKAAVDAAAAKAKPAQDNLAAAQKALGEWTAKLAAADQLVDSARAAHATAFVTWTAHGQAAASAGQRLAEARQLADHGRLQEAALASLQAADKVRADLATDRTTLAARETAHHQKQAELAALQMPAAEAGKALMAMQQQLAAKKGVVDAVVEAAAKTQIAHQKIPDQADMAQAAAKLKVLADRLGAELAQMQAALKPIEAAAADATAKLAAAQASSQAIALEMAAIQKRVADLDRQLKPAQDKAAADRSAADESFQKLTGLWTRQFSTSAMTPLTPEQLAWSTMQAVGLIELTSAATEAEISQKSPLTDAIKNDPAQMAARAAQVDQAVYEKLKAHEGKFIQLFSAGAGESQDVFFATVDQALFLANDGLVRSWLAPSNGNLTDRLNKAADPKVLAEELYVSVLNRRPVEAEIAEVAKYLAARPTERVACIQELAWGLLASAEFRFRH